MAYDHSNGIEFREMQSGGGAFSSLFVDYLGDFRSVEKFYGGDFRNEAHWKTLLRKVSERPIDRSSLVQILGTQNRNFHCGVRTLANIDALLNDNTVAVVTGQQVGLFTGPVYTILKTLTTLKLVESLSQQYPEYNFVPVFWLEGEDHDIAEVNSIKVLSVSNDIQEFRYEMKRASDDQNLGAVGKIEFDESIDSIFDNLEQSLIQTEFKSKVLELFRMAYQKGMTFNRAFVHLMNVLLENSGLVFLDPNDNEVKKLLAPLFQRELAETPKFCQLVIDQSAELEKQYHAQIKPKSLNLFFFHHGGRYLLEPRPDGYSLKGTRQHLTKEFVTEAAKQTPQLFSPNVVLRPICQDWLLPTLAYVAGPAEVAYFGQLRSLYEAVNIPMPIIYPRASATILEEKADKVLERFSISLVDIYRDVEIVKEKVAAQVSDLNLDEVFGGTFASVQEAFEGIAQVLQRIDPTLNGALENVSRKTTVNIEGLKERAVAAQKRQHEVSLRQIDKVSNLVFPQGNYQERELNVVYFLNKYGPEFLRWLYGELKIDLFKHQVIRL
ncbi:MAG: bacillithiol biosynthesis cysteine-adding enzyme BshC [Ignavibacteriales bacterium]|nr:bacillithiol biosynthesis cysteine-adding enzyme BshC [Ignavibacteriales bacterium]